MRVVLLALTLLALPAAAEDEWKLLGTFDGTTVERRENKEGPPTLRCTSVLDAPLEVAKTVMTGFEWNKWMNDVHSFEILERDDAARTAVLYGRHNTPWPIANRDYVVRAKWEETPDSFVLNTRGLKGAGPATPRGVVRLMPRATWAFTRQGEKTRFVYTYKGGAGGNIPGWMVEGSYKTDGPRMAQKMRALLKKR